MESLYAKHYNEAGDRLFLRPFPQRPPTGMTVPAFRTKYRKEMLSKTGSCIFIAGNKIVSGKVVEADGVVEEFEIATGLGQFPILIGATGHAARTLWGRVNNDLDKYYPGGGVKNHFKVLGDEASTNKELVDAVVAILKHVKAI
jgi:hypothetical protein